MKIGWLREKRTSIEILALTIGLFFLAACQYEAARKPPEAPTKPDKPPNFYTSKEWRKLRYAILVRDRGTCQACGATAQDGVQIHVDHILPRSKFSALELDPTNLQCLCAPCNVAKSNIDMTDHRKS